METICEIFDYSVRTFGQRVAVQSGGGKRGVAYTYRQLGWLAAGAAGRLEAMGVDTGSPVALLCENQPRWAGAYFAIHLRGAVCVPLDARTKAGEIRTIIQRSRAKVLIVSQAMEPVAAEALTGVDGVAVVKFDQLVTDDDIREGPPPTQPADPVCGDDTAVISFTSGTTGQSKGIVLTHRNIASNAVAGVEMLGVTGDDRMLSILPLNHMFEQTGGLLVPMVRGCSVTYPGSMNPRAIVEAMRATGTTIMLVAPAIARLLQKQILTSVKSQPSWKQRLFSATLTLSKLLRPMQPGKLLFGKVHQAFGGKLRFFVSGGAALDARLAEFFTDIGLPVLQGYGLAETAPIVSCNTLDGHVLGSVGRLLPKVEVKIDRPADSNGAGEGEILVRGPNVMAGYFEDPAATEAVFDDGWFRTGDLGRLDRRGYLYITGRIKDVIVGESGKNVYPGEIEVELARSPLFSEVCVLGVTPTDGKKRTEQVAVLVVPDAESLGGEYQSAHDELLRNDVRKACMQLADYKRPKLFGVWHGEFPRTTTMKIKKHEVRKRLSEFPLKPL